MDSPDRPDTASGTKRPPGRSFDLYSKITQQIISALEKGVVPWRSPILGQGTIGFPKNLNTGKKYRGVNVFLLAMAAYARGFESSYWLTYDQARGRGGNVRKGEKSSLVVFWKPIDVTDKETGEKKKAFVLRYYSVFNVCQCDGVERPDVVPFTPTPVKPIEAAERIVKGYRDGPRVVHGGSQAFYRPSDDCVYIADPGRFTATEEYFSTLFHELSHSTGHSRRLDRRLDKELRPFGSQDYGKEELIAEMSAAFLCGEAGISPAVIGNQASYLSGWLGKLRSDKTLVIHAAGAAARSAEWILGQRAASEMSGEGSAPAEGTGGNIPAPTSEAARALNHSAVPGTRRPDLENAARAYINAGYAVVPVPAGQKGPELRNWQSLRLTTAEVPRAFRHAGNIGIILGKPSGDLVDVDLDCPEARALAQHHLPHTAVITGRPSSPRSHWWYICPDLQTRRFRDPVSHASIIEARGTGSQTLVGPSIHPSGEPYDPLEGVPTRVDAEALLTAVKRLSDEVIRLRHGETALASDPPAAPDRSAPACTTPDHQNVLRRAAAYLGALPPAISGQGGHNITFTAATALVHGFCLSEAEALQLLQHQYNPKCQPPWSEKELLHKVREASCRPHERPAGWLLGPRT